MQQQWVSQFEDLEDPRGLQGQTHAFLSIVLIAILATIGGASGWEDIELYAESHQLWLESFLDLRHGIPREVFLHKLDRLHLNSGLSLPTSEVFKACPIYADNVVRRGQVV